MDPDDDLGFEVAPAETRRCRRCHVERPLELFYVELEKREAAKRGRADPIRMPCRLCNREVNTANRKPRQDFVDRIKLEAGCADCGIRSTHPEIYDFDHRPGTEKLSNISTLLTRGSMDALEAEIAKCDVVCANCHRIRTRARAPLGFLIDKPRTTAEDLYTRRDL